MFGSEQSPIMSDPTVPPVALPVPAPRKGTLLEDVSVTGVYLWDIEDLKTKFPSANVPNKMMNISFGHRNPYFFPSSSSSSRASWSSCSMVPPALKRAKLEAEQEEASVNVPTEYNKLMAKHECVLGEIVRKPDQAPYTQAYVRAGPSKVLHFDPQTVNAAIVTCGGLCPGLNNVTRDIVMTLKTAYGCTGTIYGIRGGFRGFYDFDNYHPISLTPELVANIHHEGGTVLGSSRGGFDLEKILHFLKDKQISCLFVIGGDGTHRGAFRTF